MNAAKVSRSRPGVFKARRHAALAVVFTTAFAGFAHAQSSSTDPVQDQLNLGFPLQQRPQSTDAAPSGAGAAAATTSSSDPSAQKILATSTDNNFNTYYGQNLSALDADKQNQTNLNAQLPPDPPSEFQRLTFESTGQRLPIYGANLFRHAPSTFAPVNNVPVSPDYAIGPGDELRIQLFGQRNALQRLIVDRTGNIAFPEVGTIHVAGVKYSQLQDFLKAQLSRSYRNFQVSVSLGQLRSIQVFVVGNARRPGSYTLGSLSTLLNALFASGGPLPQGTLRDIQVQRDGQTVAHFDLYDILLHGDKSKDIALQSSDVIFIPPVGPQVALSGSVNTPGIYEFKPGTTVRQAIEFAGGETAVALGGQVRIERIAEKANRALADVDLERYNPVLENGDILEIGEIEGKYRNGVTLRGNVALPGRYVWKPGMRVADLIANKDQLITRDYYRRRNALGVTPLEYSANGQALRSSASDLQRSTDATRAGGSQGATAPPSSSPATPTADASNPNADPNAVADQVAAASAANNSLGAGVRQAQTYDNGVRGASNSNSTSGGSSLGSALTNSNGLFPAVNDVVLSAPDIDWSYAVIERLDEHTLTTSLLPFNPGKLFLDNDQSQNLELKSGDIVTFFSTADIKVPTVQQTRFVRLEGEFLASGIYSVQPGETLRQLLHRAGGFTPTAYLYGSEFTRQSTRRVQQQRLSEYADNLENLINTRAAADNAQAVSALDTAAAQASALQANQVVARLRRVQPIGRIVLEVKPDSQGVDAVPDLPLEDGDRFVVPRVPDTVSVEGQVYSANAFVYTHGRKERDYLKQAGGPDRNADKKRTFVLRADGSVFSRQYGNVEKASIFPGDTIIVPPQISHTAILRNLVDLSQVIGGIGLGAAAINVLK